jgi:hypothetical protein
MPERFPSGKRQRFAAPGDGPRRAMVTFVEANLADRFPAADRQRFDAPLPYRPDDSATDATGSRQNRATSNDLPSSANPPDETRPERRR